ncbi:MAG: 5'-nucleotidase C-terminal domain-containing protein [Pseudomonadales bacterium]
MQVSGMVVRYDLSKPVGQRAHEVNINGNKLNANQDYVVATVEILAQGGDLFTAFRGAERLV